MTIAAGSAGTIANRAGAPVRAGRLVARDVAVRFGGQNGTLALDGMDLEVERGQVVATIGPNGCGKSTFLRVIAGLLPADRGAVTLGDRSIAGPDPRIGLVFQEPRLLPWRSSADNITYPLELAAVLLLVAIVAAITLTMRRRAGLKYQDINKQVAVRREDRVRLVKMAAEKRP